MTGEPIGLGELASRVGATLDGDGAVAIHRIGTLENAGPGAIAFLASAKYRSQLAATRATAVIVAPADAQATALPKLVHPNPYATYARVASILHPSTPPEPGVDPTARVAITASIDPSASVGPFAVIGANARVGARAVVGAHCAVGDDASIGEDAQLYPHVTLYGRSVVGARTIVHSGAVIGADGFGMAEDEGRWVKIPQVGRVVIGDDCEIGANTTIDRGAIDDTVIEDDVKLDNQIQVGHNCRIGAHTAIAGCVGIAGSANIGRSVRIGGASNIGGHITIADGVVIGGATAVLGNIREPGVYIGAFPWMPQKEWRRVAVEVRRLRMLSSRVAALERALRVQQTGDQEGTTK
jgi:UDP-3-O-[3-hydroxymyristoyl] glucosamine N-acyltransferase